MQKLIKTQKSTNNPMSSFSLIEEIMELSHIHLAVTSNKTYRTLSKNLVKLCRVITLKFLRSSVNSIARCLLTTGLIGITDPANWLAFLMSSSVASPFLGFFEFTGNKINLDWYSFNLNFEKKKPREIT